MNFVAEILCSADRIELEDLSKRVPEVVASIDGFKQNVLHYIEEIYLNFSSLPKRSTALVNQADSLKSTVSNIDQTISGLRNNDIKEVKDNVAAYKVQLFEAVHCLSLTNSLIKMHEMLQQLEICLQTKKYCDSIKLTEDINQLTIEGDITYLDAFDSLLNRCLKIQDLLSVQLIKEYKECIQYDEIQTVSITIKKCANIEDIIKATSFYKNDLIQEAISFIWDKMFNAIINSRTSIAIMENDGSKLVLNVINEKPHYKEVFTNIITLVKFLQSNFNYLLSNGASFIDDMASQLHEKLPELLIKDCLYHTIPSNNEEFEQYHYIVADIEHFQNELIKFSILPDRADFLTSYVQNIDVLFRDKKCQEYIRVATEIMKKDLHDMVEIGVSAAEDASILESKDIFPRSFVSKSVLELLKLADKIMYSAKDSDLGREKLYSTIENIFNSYGPVVQSHHQKLLQTIPQQVALFHNNCMYLSYTLSIWNKTYQDLPHHTEQMFVGSSHLLREIGNKAFIDSIEQQIKQIEDILKESGLISCSTLDKLEPITEKSIRQCLRQQELLRTVWHNVLSHLDYNRSIGCILNVLCNFIINAVVKIEDIAAEPGEQLVDIVRVILSRGPKLFTNPNDVQLYVKSWYRFNELVFILSSRLIDICDRWAEGKGPLALQFKPEEVQKLIRALFQNTDQRAAVLTKIVKYR